MFLAIYICFVPKFITIHPSIYLSHVASLTQTPNPYIFILLDLSLDSSLPRPFLCLHRSLSVELSSYRAPSCSFSSSQLFTESPRIASARVCSAAAPDCSAPAPRLAARPRQLLRAPVRLSSLVSPRLLPGSSWGILLELGLWLCITFVHDFDLKCIELRFMLVFMYVSNWGLCFSFTYVGLCVYKIIVDGVSVVEMLL